MKKFLYLTCIALLFLAPACRKNTCKQTYQIYEPIFKSLTSVRAEMKSSAPRKLENTGKIYTYGKYIFLNEELKGIHVIDNSNPAQPMNIGFVNIPGNVDMAVKGNYLFADCYSDIVVFDITNPANISAKKFLDNAIPEAGYYWNGNNNPDSVQVLVDYNVHDTTVDCDAYNGFYFCGTDKAFTTSSGAALANAASAPSAQGGSMARFTVVNDFLYGVSFNKLYSFNITSPVNIQFAQSKTIGNGIETIYPFGNSLFIGSTAGMFIYDLTQPADPKLQGSFSHARSCDPVISDGQFAYVTLRSGNACAGTSNQMDVLDVSNLSSVKFLKTYAMSNPHGLSKDGSLLFVCDGAAGFKVFDAANPNNVQLVKEFKGPDTYDVITASGNAIVVATDGLYQYDYSNPASIHLRSKLAIARKN